MKKRRSHEKKKRGMKRGIYVVPNLLTSGNLFLGFYAIIATFHEKYYIAAVAILAAILFDGIDGKVARLTKATSRFGVEFDSLADLVSFGVAPAILVFSWALQPYGRFGWLAAFLYVACGALRLARFNIQVDTVESRYFRGLPIPGAASLIATTVLFFHWMGEEGVIKHPLVLLLIYALAFLMVSRIRYYSFKDLNLLKRKPFSSLVTLVLIIVVVMAAPEIVLFIFASLYLILGPANALVGWYKKREIVVRDEKKASLMQ